MRFLTGKALKISAVAPLGQGAWLLNGGDGLPFLGHAITACEQYKLEYRVILIESATEWTAAAKPEAAKTA